MSYLKQNIIVILAFATPVIFIGVVAASVYIPSLFIKTQYDFVYASCDMNYYHPMSCHDYLKKKYEVVDGKLIINDIKSFSSLDEKLPDEQVDYSYSDRLFLYDTSDFERHEIDAKEAKVFKYNDLKTSPDGVTFYSSYQDSINNPFFLFSNNSSGLNYYLEQNKWRKAIKIDQDNSYSYQDSAYFIGWVIN